MNNRFTTLWLVAIGVLCHVSSLAQGRLFVMNFTVNGEVATKMGQNVAGIIEQGLRCCGCRYAVVQRFGVLHASQPGPALAQELAAKEVDYLLQGDIHDLGDGALYQVDYRIEERSTLSTVAVGSFKAHRDALLDMPSCETALGARMSLDDGLCRQKVISDRPLVAQRRVVDKAKPLQDSGVKVEIGAELAGDEDADGVINALDLEPNTPEGAMVDRSGRAIDPSAFVYLKKVKEELKDNLPTLPWIAFEEGATTVPVDAQAALAQVATWMRHYPSMIVSIEGRDPADMVKAYDRAKAIRRLLLEHHEVEAQRLRLRYDVAPTYASEVQLSFDLNASQF